MTRSLASLVGPVGVVACHQVQEGHDESQTRGGSLGLPVADAVLVLALVEEDEVPQAPGQAQYQGYHVVHDLKECLGQYGGCGDGAEAGEEENEGGDETGGHHQEEEHLGYVLVRVVEVEVVAHDTHGHDTQQYLQEHDEARGLLHVAHVDEDRRGCRGGGHAVDCYLR